MKRPVIVAHTKLDHGDWDAGYREKKGGNVEIKHRVGKYRSRSKVIYCKLRFERRVKMNLVSRRVVMVDNTYENWIGTSMPFIRIQRNGFFPRWKDGLTFIVEYKRPKVGEQGILRINNCAIPESWGRYRRTNIFIVKR